jgi:hypothetical protein
VNTSATQHVRRDLRRAAVACLAVSLLLAPLGGCSVPDYNDPEFLAQKIRSGDGRAFDTVERLEDPEARVALIPALIEAYDNGIERDRIVAILAETGHPSGMPVLLSALESPDNRAASIAARGIAATGDASQAGAIAERLQRVRDPQEYEPFLEALSRLPGDQGAVPIVRDIVTRRVGAVGGINTIRYGCRILGSSGATDQATIDALLFGLVNLQMQPYQDAMNECSLALVQIGAPAHEPLMAMLQGNNETVANHLVSLGVTNAGGALRAARVIADIAAPSGFDSVASWFNTPHEVTREFLESLGLEGAQNWFANFAETFTYLAEYLGYVAEPGENPAHSLLLGLLNRGEGSPLHNFDGFMGTSNDAELGLRTAVMDALVNVGDPADRDAVLAVAQAGELTRGEARFLRQHAAFAFAMLSQPGDLARFDELRGTIEDANLLTNVEPYRPMIEQVAEGCAGDRGASGRYTATGCLEGLLGTSDDWVFRKVVYDLSHFTENQPAAASVLIGALEAASLERRYEILDQLRNLTLPQTAGDQLQTLIEGAEGTAQFRDYRAALRFAQHRATGG